MLEDIDAAVFAVKILRALRNLAGVKMERHGTGPASRELVGTPPPFKALCDRIEGSRDLNQWQPTESGRPCSGRSPRG